MEIAKIELDSLADRDDSRLHANSVNLRVERRIGDGGTGAEAVVIGVTAGGPPVRGIPSVGSETATVAAVSLSSVLLRAGSEVTLR